MNTIEPITIDKHIKVNDPKKTLNSLINYMKGNKGNKRFMPYYKLAIQIIKQNENRTNSKREGLQGNG